jgi:LuxR family transcriptional regulator, maltose regulon positive regulatory protein
MQGQSDPAGFIKSFTGSHRFVLDYLIEEVLGRQPENIQAFLLRTSILDRMCGPLCDAVLDSPLRSGRKPWNTSNAPTCSSSIWITNGAGIAITTCLESCCCQRLGQPRELPEYHLRASAWYEVNDDLAEAFQHALAAGEFEREPRAWQNKPGRAWNAISRLPPGLAW